MALSHTDLEMVTVRGVTFLIDPSTFVEGCTYLLVGSGTVEPVDSVPVPSAALLLNLGRGGSTPEERDRSLQVGDLLLRGPWRCSSRYSQSCSTGNGSYPEAVDP